MIESRSARALRPLVVAIGGSALLLAGFVILGGWMFGIEALKQVFPGFATMKPNTAMAVAALAGALLLGRRNCVDRVIGNILASFVLALGALTLAEYILDWDAGIDHLLFRGNPATSYRPAIATALMLILLSGALLCRSTPALHRLKGPAALAALLISWASLNGYLFGSQALAEVPMFSSVALHTTAILLALAIGVLATEPVSAPIRMVIAEGTAATICRWLLPPAILAPPLLGWLFDRINMTTALPSDFLWALYSVASSSGSVALVILMARRIAIIDAERSAATALSREDPLTQLANRRAFDSFLAEMFDLAQRHGHRLSLIALDVDEFKSYNDRYGHPAGDELLKTLAVLLTSLARETDLVSRTGGEEFAIVMPHTDLAGAQALADRIRIEVEHSSRFAQRVTVSIGVASKSPAGGTPESLVQKADAALYSAKGSGRNRVCCGTQESESPNTSAAAQLSASNRV